MLKVLPMPVRLTASAALFAVVVLLSAPWLFSDEETPHYNAAPAKSERLPAILTDDQLWGINAQHAYQLHAYKLAAKIPRVLYQQPCYCYCDRSMGHTSLHSCFEGTHGAECSTCLRELYYTYSAYKKGKSAGQIRAGIILGDWKTIDLEKAASIE
jgi:Protein of unknown function with PCYCGC motif